MRDFKDTIKSLISKLTQDSASVFSQKIFSEASEAGIGEMAVIESLSMLKDERSIEEPVPGVIKRNF